MNSEPRCDNPLVRNAVCAGVGLGVVMLLVAIRPARLPLDATVIGIATVLAGLVPSYWYFFGRTAGAFPTFALTGLFYSICFGAPVFLLDFIWPPGTPKSVFIYPIVDETILYRREMMLSVLAGVLLMLAGYRLGLTRLFKRAPRFTLPAAYDPHRAALLAWGLLLARIAHLYIPAIQKLPSVGQFLVPAGYVAIAAFFMLMRDGKIGRLQAALVFGVAVPVMAIKIALTGALAPIMLFVFLGVLLLVYARAWRTVFALGMAAVIIIIAYGPVTVFREQTWQTKTFRELPMTAQIAKLFTTHDQAYAQRRGLANHARAGIKRLSRLPLYAVVADTTPDPVPYWGGETYKPLLTSFIPRALWPDKPLENNGFTFGNRYNLIGPRHFDSSVNIPWIVEMRANFGLIGVLMGMSLVGLFMAFLDRVFNRPNAAALDLGVGVAIIFPLVYQESNFSLMTGSLLPLTVCMWLYFRFGLTLLPTLESRVLAALGRRPK